MLYRADSTIWQKIRTTLTPAAEPDLRADDAFWAQYDGRVAEVANMMNDTYLKANGQKTGRSKLRKDDSLLVAFYQMSYLENSRIE